MVKVQILMAVLAGAISATALFSNVSFSRKFATEKLNIDSPFYDLSDFGYFGGQLPKIYGLSQNDSGAVYLPEESFKEFRNIISGTNNASNDFITQQKALQSNVK
ncbi:hypothetical protein N7507_002400 [Penicillium longicatenatum]|nr:hypothetical protein N7507_002400 [Penicillium longicatenatum]